MAICAIRLADLWERPELLIHFGDGEALSSFRNSCPLSETFHSVAHVLFRQSIVLGNNVVWPPSDGPGPVS
jgi:hypothetical protein